MKTVGLLTGTFDPIHLGHGALAQAAMRACELDEVWILVNPEPAHKEAVTAFEQRLAMAELAVDGVDGLHVYHGSLSQAPHVIGTFEAIQADHPDIDFVFILGIDTFARLDRWDNVQSVVTRASYVVAHRPGTPTGAVAGLKSRLGELAGRLTVQEFEFDDHGMASSTEIRRQVAAGERPLSLDERVYEYIVRLGLYLSLG